MTHDEVNSAAFIQTVYVLQVMFFILYNFVVDNKYFKIFSYVLITDLITQSANRWFTFERTAGAVHVYEYVSTTDCIVRELSLIHI